MNKYENRENFQRENCFELHQSSLKIQSDDLLKESYVLRAESHVLRAESHEIVERAKAARERARLSIIRSLKRKADSITEAHLDVEMASCLISVDQPGNSEPALNISAEMGCFWHNQRF